MTNMERDALLKQSWEAFCDELKAAGDLIFRETTPDNDLTRAKGLRLLARNISLALQFNLDNIDTTHPELLHYFDPIRKQGGDNTDALYVGAQINGQNTYRIYGNRGQAKFFAVTVLEDGNTPWGGAVVGNMIDEQIDVDEDGNFEIIVSPHEHAGNWIKSTPGTWRVTFRQFFADWANEEPMMARIDCLDGPPHDPILSLQQITEGLEKTAKWVNVSTHYWANMIDKWAVQPNTFLSYRQLDDNDIDATPGGEPLICFWQLPEDEALIVRFTPPACDYWAVEFGNYWWETMDYRYRMSSTNCHMAQLEENGEMILVVSHQDLAYANWLDPSGHSEGYITLRYLGAADYPIPACEQVKVTELADRLPAGIRTVSKDQRRAQLEERRSGIIRRFKY
ncbi:MAG: DUF1214 domain-containing protein [Parvibaculales bacterium]